MPWWLIYKAWASPSKNVNEIAIGRTMEINDLRAAITLVSFLSFIGIVFWAYSGKRKDQFARASESVLKEEGSGQ